MSFPLSREASPRWSTHQRVVARASCMRSSKTCSQHRSEHLQLCEVSFVPRTEHGFLRMFCWQHFHQINTSHRPLEEHTEHGMGWDAHCASRDTSGGARLVWKGALLQKHPRGNPAWKKLLQGQKRISHPQFKCPLSI